MLTLDVKSGQAVQIGDAAVVKVGWKSGQRVKLSFATALPIRLLADGVIPTRFIHGVTGEPQPVRSPRILAAAG